MINQGRLFADARLAVLGQAELPGAPLQDLRQVFLHGASDLGLINSTDRPSEVDARIPRLNRWQAGQPRYVLAIGSGRETRQIAGGRFGILGNATRHDETGGQPLYVPLKGSGESLVEVIDVENRGSFRRRIGPEIRQMRVATSLQSNICRRAAT